MVRGQKKMIKLVVCWLCVGKGYYINWDSAVSKWEVCDICFGKGQINKWQV